MSDRVRPPTTAKESAIKVFGPKHNFVEVTLNKRAHVITDSEETELIVPVHHPIKCACIIKALLTS